MPRKRRQSRIPTPAWERPHGAIGSRVLGLPPRVYATLGIAGLVVLALGIIAYTVISDEIADRNRPGSTVVKIDDRKFSLDYFVSRVETYIQQNGGEGVVTPQNYQVAVGSVQGQLIEEQLLLRFAGEKGEAATDKEVNQEIATRMSTAESPINPDDPNFGTRFQQELNRTGLSEDEYREIATAAVLRTKVLAKFTTEVTPTAEAVHYRLIAVAGQAEADDLAGQIEAGADFAALAKEKSLDTTTKESGGDAGWVPKGILEDAVEEHLFAQEVNKVTTYPTASNVFVFQVTEKAADHALEEPIKASLAETNFSDWITEKQEALTIKEFDLTNANNLEYLISNAWTSF